MKTKILLFIILFVYPGTIFISPRLIENTTKAFVDDPNGIYLYSYSSDEKFTPSYKTLIDVPYKTMLRLIEAPDIQYKKENDVTLIQYRLVIFQNKMYAIDRSVSLLEFSPVKEEKYVRVLNEFSRIQNIPFEDSEILKENPEYMVLKVNSTNSIWLEIESGNMKGFIKRKYISEPDSKEKVSDLIRLDNLDGYFLLTATPKYYDYNAKSNSLDIKPSTPNTFPQKDDFVKVYQAVEKEGNAYCLIGFYQTNEKNNIPIEQRVWVQKKDGKNFSKKDFSLYTLQKSKYKNDSFIQKLTAPYITEGLNYETLLVEKVKSKTENFYVIDFKNGFQKNENPNTNDNKYLIARGDGKNFKLIYKSDYRVGTVVGDLDGDGIPEIMSQLGGRTSDYTGIFTIKNNKIKLVESFPYHIEIKDRNIYMLVPQYDYQEGKQVNKYVFQKYKYKSGDMFRAREKQDEDTE